LNKNSKLSFTPISVLSDSDSKKYSNFINIMIGNHMVSNHYIVKQNYITITNINTGLVKNVRIDDKSNGNINVQYVYPEKKVIFNNAFYVITDSAILKCKLSSDSLVIEHIYKIPGFVNSNNINGGKINTVHNSSFWNYCIGTTTNGIWINYNNSDI